MNLEYFEHDIFEMPSAKDLLKYIIKRLNRTNDKIKFLDFHFAQDFKHLPLEMLTRDDGDSEE